MTPDNHATFGERQAIRKRRHRHKEFGEWLETWRFDGVLSVKVWERGARIKLRGEEALEFTIAEPEGFVQGIRDELRDGKLSNRELYEQLAKEAER